MDVIGLTQPGYGCDASGGMADGRADEMKRDVKQELHLKKYLTDYDFPADLKRMHTDELDVLSAQIRDFLIENVARTGGHLAPNLGVVELSVALHRVFDVPEDKIIWDVGHQSYTHKILTGRAGLFPTLRQEGGLSGFPKPAESAADVWMGGHASTSVSAAMGIAEARDLSGGHFDVVAVIGDGAMTGGEAYEGLNNAGTKRTRMIVVLNDNNMSIGENVGSLSQHLSHLRASKTYLDMKRKIKSGIQHVPGIGESLFRGLGHVRDMVRYALITESIFEDLGFSYFGPVDGHDIAELIEILSGVRNIDGPVLIHAVTRKGKGYRNAEERPGKFHGIEPFDTETGLVHKAGANGADGADEAAKSWSELAGRELLRAAGQDDRVVAITAAMADGTGLATFSKEYPKRFYDVGIAEGHAVTFAAGLAIGGMRPFVCVYSTFLQRAYDQIISETALQGLPVVFLIDRAGNVGADGETHHGVFDLSYLGHIPGIRILAPSDAATFAAMMDYALQADGPVCIRYPRGVAPAALPADPRLETGRARLLRVPQAGNPAADAPRILLMGLGALAETALAAAGILGSRGIVAEVADPLFAKPFDEELLLDCAHRGLPILTAEDNVLRGGFGEGVGAFLHRHAPELPFIALGWPDRFIQQGDRSNFLREHGLDAEGLARSAEALLQSSGAHAAGKG